MTTSETITFFGAVIAWDTICIQLLIIPFLRKAENLHKDYLTDGVLDAALSSIETKKLIPALANMFVRIREAQGDRRRTLGDEELQEILQQIDYIPDLQLAQEAMDQNNELKALFDSLQNSTGRVWRLALIHAIIMLFIPASNCIAAGYSTVAMTATIILAITTLLVAGRSFWGFEKEMKKFLDLLKRSR